MIATLRRGLSSGLAVAMFALPLTANADAPVVSLGDYRADPASVTVSGISSGGYMAHQFHIAYSDAVIGAGVVAGGPYRCAAHGPSSQGECNAVTRCMQFPDRVPLAFCPSLPRRPFFFGTIDFTGPPDIAPLVQDTRDLAARDAIAAPENLCGDRMLLLYGQFDQLVPESIVRSLGGYLDAVLDCSADRPTATFEIREMPQAAHTMPINDRADVNWPCSASEPPYLGECGYSAAAQILDFLYETPVPAAEVATAGASGLLRFAQSDSIAEPALAALAEYGYLYVPAACVGNAACRLHVAFHGCRQSARSPEMGETFVRDAGYNDWADANLAIILYPQVYHPDGSFDHWALSNPRGCWDWWGYTDGSYATRTGAQMDGVKTMIDTLVAGGT